MSRVRAGSRRSCTKPAASSLPGGVSPHSSASVANSETCVTGRLAARVFRRQPGDAHDQRHAHRGLEEDELLPEAVLAEHLAVVGSVDDNRVALEAGFFERRHHLPDRIVKLRDRGVVESHAEARLRGVAQLRRRAALPDGFDDLLGQLRQVRLAPRIGQLHVLRPVHARQAFRGHKRVVRLEERTDQEERLAGAVVLEEADALARDETLEMIPLGNFRDAAHVHEAFATVLLSRAFPRVAEIAPQVVDLREAGTRIAAAQLVGVELGLRDRDTGTSR